MENPASQTARGEVGGSDETPVNATPLDAAGERSLDDESAPAKRQHPLPPPPPLINEAAELNRSSSSTGPGSLRSPTSPNPSFSSLQARPTPPATSGRNSPSPSLLAGSSIVREANEDAFSENPSTSTLRQGDADDAADPLAALRTPQANREFIKTDTQTTETHSFPNALLEAGGGASLGIDVNPPESNQVRSVDHDSDVYGQPSPRQGSSSAASTAPFAAGYGEVPYGLDEPATSSRTDSAAKKPADAEPSVHTFQIRVGDPQKVGDPVTAHIVYTVRIKTNSPRLRSSQFSVLRRYSDFRWLHAALVHNNPGIFIPPVPEKVRTGRFAPDLVEARRHGLESCINKIANNPVLQLDDDFRLFLESQNFHADVKLRDQIKGPVPTPEQKTYFGWSTSFTGSSHRFHETDEWFDEQKVYLDHLEMHLKTLVRIISTLAQQRKEVAAATSESSHAFMMLSGSSLSRSLSTCFAGLGEVERRTFELGDLQADADVREFASVVYEFERMVGSARKAFATRIDAWQAWQRFEDEAKKVRVKHEKVKKDMQPGSYRAHDGGRLQAVLDELASAESRCMNSKREFDLIGRRCKEQMVLFEADRIKAFHQACEVWLQGMIERNTEIMAEWEQYAALLERQTGQKVKVD